MEYRQKRVEEGLKREISSIILKELREEALGFVTVTKVKCTPDLKEAKVYVSIYEEDPRQKQVKFNRIKKNASQIRGLLGSRIHLKYVPFLHFHLDESLDYVDHIEELIRKAHQQSEENE